MSSFALCVVTLYSTNVLRSDPHKRDFIGRLNASGVTPNNTSSKTSIDGHITVSHRVMPELSANYFITNNLAFEIITASTKHKITAKNTTIGDVNVCNGWILPPTLTAQWHFYLIKLLILT